MFLILETYFRMLTLSCVALNECFMILTLVTLTQLCCHSVRRWVVFYHLEVQLIKRVNPLFVSKNKSVTTKKNTLYIYEDFK